MTRYLIWLKGFHPGKKSTKKKTKRASVHGAIAGWRVAWAKSRSIVSSVGRRRARTVGTAKGIPWPTNVRRGVAIGRKLLHPVRSQILHVEVPRDPLWSERTAPGTGRDHGRDASEGTIGFINKQWESVVGGSVQLISERFREIQRRKILEEHIKIAKDWWDSRIGSTHWRQHKRK